MGCKARGCGAGGGVCEHVGFPGAEVAPGVLLLLPKGLQGWCGQQSPPHSLGVCQSLLWAVAAPQLGSPLL